MALRPRLSEGQPCLLGYVISISFFNFFIFFGVNIDGKRIIQECHFFARV